MPVSVSEQTIVFTGCILSGLIIGILYDIIGALRNGLRLRRVVAFMLDWIFWLISVVIFFATLYITCGGKASWYAPLGGVLGLAFYYVSLSRFFLPPVTYIVTFLRKLTMKLLMLFIRPMKWIIKLLIKIFRHVVKNIQNTQKKQRKFVKKTLEKIRRFGVILKMY